MKKAVQTEPPERGKNDSFFHCPYRYRLQWAIPLLIIVCFIVRLEKNPVFDGPKIFRETVRLSLCAAGVMVLLALIIFGIVEFFC